MKLLIIDDEKFVVKRIVWNFVHENWTIDVASSYNSAYNTLKAKKYDIIICDYNLWDSSENWLNLIKQIRFDWNTTPVILLTWKSFDEITPWDALEAGFDDFVKKPYEPKELKARVSAILRRRIWNWVNLSNSLFYKDLEINFSNRKVILDWKNIKLWNTLFLILYELVKSKWKIVSYENLIEYIWWEPSLYVPQYSSTLRVHVTHLKKILWLDFSKNLKTVHWVWYILENEKYLYEE